jgi:excinuclease ABC subunit B
MQTIGRAARNVNAKVILYADKVTDSMQRAIDETARRRKLQEAYNQKHGITPETIRKAIHRGIEATAAAHAQANAAVGRTEETRYITEEYVAELESEMLSAAENLEFERAAAIRDRIEQMQDAIGEPIDSITEKVGGGGKRRRSAAKLGGKVPRPKRGV